MRTFIIIFITFITIPAHAQQNPSTSLSLQDCIEIALQNNINLKRTNLKEQTAELSFKQTRDNVFPTLNGNYNIGINNGRSVDPYTNNIIDQQLKFSNAGINLNSRLFKGFELRNSIQRDRFAMKAAEADTEAARQQLVLNVTLAYYRILNSEDLLNLAKLRLQSTQEQTERLQNLYEQGEGNPADYTDIKGQLKNDQSNVLDAQRELKSSKLELAQLLNIEAELEIDQFHTLTELQPYPISANQVYKESLENLATFKAKEFQIQAAQEDVHASQALYFPEFSFFAQLNTNFSSLARLFNETGTQITETGQFITLGEINYPVFMTESRFAEEKINYLDQLENNLNSVIGVAVAIPIFNGFQAKHTVDLKKIELQDAKLEMEDTKKQYLKEIHLAYTNMETAYQNYFILKDQVDAYQESYRVNEIRFSNGVSNIVEYIISKNNLDQSRINLANTKYEYLVRIKILDYYSGESGEFN